ncbi:tyrosine-type recombinase/integrase [Nitratidesulfovibrio liaohensis]|uniref:tyrosine-type recombinase/integrase n=1 Tax=Nitratidesulfovibrio liaohensis TaxID=2604158 RepID=UPI00141E6396|nr:site-specific integrase [Nitratidesulfovibrio liaohensis]
MSEETGKNRTKWTTVERGIRKYEHLTRKHGKKPDAYFALRYKIDGESREEGLGWASQGWTLEKARQTLAEIRAAKKTGSGPVTLQERRKKAEDARQADRLKPTMTLLWETYKAAHGDRPSAKPDARNVRPILARFAKKTPEDIRTAHVDALRRDLEAEGKAPQTVKHVLGLLRRLIRYGAKRGLCSMPDISRLHFDMPKVDNIKTECLTPEQAKALFDALDEDEDQNLAAMVRLALATGMRRGALLGLQWDDLDFRNGHIHLRGAVAKSGKTTQIPMTEAARTILQSIQPTGSPYLFPGKDGGKRVEVRRFLDRIRKKAGLPDDFRPLHGLRHTYASWLASSGKVDLFTLQKLLTHGSPQMTQRYAHLADEAMKRAASVIDECFAVAINAEPAKPAKSKIVPFKK